jgi:peptidoglycan/xylan/chitin deacetylase (PgdA/CDA1 family)
MVGLLLSAALGLLPTAEGVPGWQANPIKRVSVTEPEVALTFDACATKTQGYGFDKGIFDTLKNEQIPATIFVSGRWVEAHPDAMEELTRDPLIEFGDHSYDHPHMSDLTPELIAQQLDYAEAALAKYGRHSVAFRPPFGEWSRRLVEVAQGRKLPTVTWDVVSGDPSAGTTAAWMIRTVVTRTKPGSIVVFHINGRGWKTAEALPEIVRGLRERGFHFVPLSHLLASGAPAVVAARPTPVPAAVVDSVPLSVVRAETMVGHAPQRAIVTRNPYSSTDAAPAPLPWPPTPGPGPGETRSASATTARPLEPVR